MSWLTLITKRFFWKENEILELHCLYVPGSWYPILATQYNSIQFSISTLMYSNSYYRLFVDNFQKKTAFKIQPCEIAVQNAIRIENIKSENAIRIAIKSEIVIKQVDPTAVLKLFRAEIVGQFFAPTMIVKNV